ncbi:MAG: hypothetical protein J6R37_01670 [Clostridia bacterium]|nr:hypothetical protein [Clostridia bacterium]
MNIQELVTKILVKKAKGYSVKEKVDEYVCDSDGNLKLTKRKVTTKHLPADLGALKILVEQDSVQSVEDLSDENLQAEKVRLLNLLQEYTNNQKEEENDNEINLQNDV